MILVRMSSGFCALSVESAIKLKTADLGELKA